LFVKLVASHTHVLDAEPHKSSKQKVIVDPLDQLPFRADRKKHSRQTRRASAAPADRLPADRRVQLGDLARQRFEHRIGDLPNHPQWMICPN
jgi:hypothetical protein